MGGRGRRNRGGGAGVGGQGWEPCGKAVAGCSARGGGALIGPSRSLDGAASRGRWACPVSAKVAAIVVTIIVVRVHSHRPAGHLRRSSDTRPLHTPPIASHAKPGPRRARRRGLPLSQERQQQRRRLSACVHAGHHLCVQRAHPDCAAGAAVLGLRGVPGGAWHVARGTWYMARFGLGDAYCNTWRMARCTPTRTRCPHTCLSFCPRVHTHANTRVGTGTAAEMPLYERESAYGTRG